MTVPQLDRIRLLVDALRSGEYVQGNECLGYIEDGQEKFCCLGVACEVAMRNGLELHRVDGILANGRAGAFAYDHPEVDEGGETRGLYLHPKVREFYGFNDYNPHLEWGEDMRAAGELNDEEHLNFTEIASAFEATFLTADVQPGG